MLQPDAWVQAIDWGALLAFVSLWLRADLELLRRWGPTVVQALWDVAAAGGALVLFSRIDRPNLLENPVRQRIHEVIQREPGVCMGDVRDRAGVAWGTTVYHLRRLERHGFVVSLRKGVSRHYFAAEGEQVTPGPQWGILRHPTLHRVALYVHAHPGSNQAGVCRDLGLQNPAASKHLSHLESIGFITTQRAGRSRLYRPTPALDAALQHAPAPRPPVAAPAPAPAAAPPADPSLPADPPPAAAPWPSLPPSVSPTASKADPGDA